jgi:hypothetical protein
LKNLILENVEILQEKLIENFITDCFIRDEKNVGIKWADL